MGQDLAYAYSKKIVINLIDTFDRYIKRGREDKHLVFSILGNKIIKVLNTTKSSKFVRIFSIISLIKISKAKSQ